MNIGCKSVRNGRLFGLQSLEGHEIMENYGVHSMDTADSKSDSMALCKSA